MQQKNVEDLIRKMEKDILSSNTIISGSALNNDDLMMAQKILLDQKELLNKLKNVEITGRVVIKLKPLEEFEGSKYDIELEEEEDRLFIPEKPGVVEVIGEVYNPTAVLYEEKQTVSYYLDKVGGTTQDANEDRIYLAKADGSVVSQSQEGFLGLHWDAENKRWSTGGFLATRVQPGDIILVPRKFEGTRWLKTTSDLVQIVFQTAVATGVLIALF